MTLDEAKIGKQLFLEDYAGCGVRKLWGSIFDSVRKRIRNHVRFSRHSVRECLNGRVRSPRRLFYTLNLPLPFPHIRSEICYYLRNKHIGIVGPESKRNRSPFKKCNVCAWFDVISS